MHTITLNRRPWVASLCLLLWSSTPAMASPLFDTIGDPAGTGGMQAATVPGGVGAAYFNPALLTDAAAQVSIGLVLLRQQIGITVEGRPGTEFAVLEGLENAARSDFSRFDNYPIATNILQYGRERGPLQTEFRARPRQAAGSGDKTQTYALLGLSVKILEDKLALAVNAAVPTGEFTTLRAFFNDEREQYFSNSLHPELYGDRLKALSLAFGVAYRLWPELSLGIGATLGLQASVVAPTFVADTSQLDQILIDLNAAVNIAIAPHFGIRFQPLPRLRVTGSLHTPIKHALRNGFTFLLANGTEQASGISFTMNYMPWRASLGAVFDLVATKTQTFSIAGTMNYAHWSGYVDRHGEQPSPSYAWNNTFAPMFGLRYRVSGWSALLDAGYRPRQSRPRRVAPTTSTTTEPRAS
ncbi:MAG: hypothetical protein OXU20_12330 [Myxococcales bacterium]|nr:hypothetical protein [Myxococcales bacterium]